jgi:hypothetical protein
MLFAVTAMTAWAAEDEKPKPLPPVEARKQVGKKCTVEMTVRATKDRLAKRKMIFLDAEEHFRDEKNFAVVITKAGADKFRQAGVKDPAAHFKGKKIHATGTVALDENKTPHIIVEDPKQIRIVEKKD